MERSYTARLPAPGEAYDEDDSDDDGESHDVSHQTAVSSKNDGSCCGCCCTDYKAIDEMAFDCVCRPVLDFLLNYFSQPTTFHLIVYFGCGCLIYRYLEDWSYSDAAYFLTVTATTVGYGDFCPVTPLGRLFTAFFSLYGISVVLGALTPVIAILHGSWREDLLGLMGSKEQVNINDMSKSIKEMNQRADYTRRYALALLSPLAVLFAGVAFYYKFIRVPPPDDAPFVYQGVDFLGIVDGLYYAVVTMTTVGYGDICPESAVAKWFAVVYLPFAVIALGDAVADVGMIKIRRAIRETDYGKFSDESLLRDATRDVAPADGEGPVEPNFQPMLTESEFVVDQLLANGLVDAEAVHIIKRQFLHLTRKGRFRADQEPMLTTKLVYEEIRERALSGMQGTLSGGAEALDLVSDEKGHSTFRWNSYEEWLQNSWQMRVLAKTSSLAEKIPEGSDRDFSSMKSLTVQHFRMM